MRLFVALWPPPPAAGDLAAAVEAAREDAPQLRWAPPVQWHLTLTFLGEVADTHRVDLDRRLARAAGRHPPLHLCFAGGGRFGHRVLFTRVEGDQTGLRRLAASTTAAARRIGLEVDARPYRPHLTLARSSARGGDQVDLRPAVQALTSYRGPEWTADSLHLVRSRLGAGPGRRAQYETIAAWTLGGNRPQRSGARDYLS
jgi:2'-5' RNA ligase